MNDVGYLSKDIVQSLKEKLLPKIGQWSLQTQKALQTSNLPQAGYRDLYFDDSPKGYHWEYPRSNSAERISAFLALYDNLKDEAYFNAAIKYADAMLDKTYGIYQGNEENCCGQVWYWRDSGSYMTNYTMRVPSAMFELYDRTKKEEYKYAAISCGEALLRCQQSNGILLEGAMPKNHQELNIANFDYDANPDYCTTYKINSRIAYATSTFATLYQRTNDDRYMLALERLSYALEKFQNEDGSIPENLSLTGYKPISPLIKNHFQSYALNGCSLSLEIFPELKSLKNFTLNLANYFIRQQRCSGGIPYGNIHNFSSLEKVIWKTSAAADCALGLKILFNLTNEIIFENTANRLLIASLLNVIDCPENPDLNGAIPIWVLSNRDNTKVIPALGGYFHFFTVLGLLK